MTIREKLEADEERVLSRFAQKSRDRKGREDLLLIERLTMIDSSDRNVNQHRFSVQCRQGEAAIAVSPGRA